MKKHNLHIKKLKVSSKSVQPFNSSVQVSLSVGDFILISLETFIQPKALLKYSGKKKFV